MTFDTAFKHLYAKELAPYGFQKVKGRRPYFVRMMGDEIVHVIAYANSWAFRPYKNFNVLWGAATVYRKRINFDINPRDTKSWTTYARDSVTRGFFEYRDESLIIPGKTYEVGGNDVDMMEELERSVEVVKQDVVPRLDQVRTLKDCMEILRGGIAFYIYDLDSEEDRIREYEEKEGMLNFKLFNLEEFEARWRRSVERMESRYQEEEIQIMNKQIAIFQKYTQDEAYHRRVEEEMQRRKTENQAILRGYGLEF